MTIGFLALTLAACGLVLVLILVGMIALILWNQSTTRDQKHESSQKGQ